MQISLKRTESEQELEVIKKLYLSAFPPSERREFEQLKSLIYNQECAINLIFDFGKLAGVVVFWNFPKFIFLEHLAVEPEMRNQGTGKRVLGLIQKTCNKPVILETEIPGDEISRRRIDFYERNGFSKLTRTYFQPSYGNNKPEVELILMSTNSDFSETELDEIIGEMRKKVYGVA